MVADGLPVEVHFPGFFIVVEVRASFYAREVADAENRLADAKSIHDGALADANGLAGNLTSVRAERARAGAEIERLAPLKQLAERWGEIEAKLDKRDTFRADTEAHERAIRQHENNVRLQEANIADLDIADAADRQRRDALAEEISGRMATLDALDEPGMMVRAERLASIGDILRDLGRVAEDYAGAAADWSATELQREAGERDLRQARQDEADARDARKAARAEVEALSGPLARAEDAASEAAATLRLRLTPGEPCAVCGSTVHPVHADARFAELAASLRADVEAAQVRFTVAGDRVVNAEGRKEGAEARIGDAMGSAERAQARMQKTTQAYTKILEAGRPLAEELALDLLCPDTPNGAAQAIAAAATLIDETRGDAATTLRRAFDLRTDVTKLTQAYNEANVGIERRATEHAFAQTAVATIVTALALGRQALATAEERLVSSDRELTPWLKPAGINMADLDQNAGAARSALIRQIEAWKNASQASVDAKDRERALEPKAAGARMLAEAAAATLTQVQRDLAQRTDFVGAKKVERAILLDGEATDAHRSRINAERATAQDAKHRGAAEAATAAAVLAAAREAVESTNQQRAQAAADLEAVEFTLARDLAGAGLARATLATLLAVEPSEIEALRDRLSAVDRGAIEAEATLAARYADLDATLTAGRPEAAKLDLEVERDTIEARQQERQARIGSVATELAKDDEQRAKVAGLDVEIVAAKDKAKIWKEVNAAVGSKNGDRFARFAQSVTLDLLVELANTHLATLQPRYKLMRSGQDLGLNVIDRDMGNEARSTRSLSGGERFLVSLALALALSGLGGRQIFADTLFIDEGFGSLDTDSLEAAIGALEMLRSQGRTVGVISHVEAMKDRIPVQVRVIRQGAGRSIVRIVAPQDWAA